MGKKLKPIFFTRNEIEFIIVLLKAEKEPIQFFRMSDNTLKCIDELIEKYEKKD